MSPLKETKGRCLFIPRGTRQALFDAFITIRLLKTFQAKVWENFGAAFKRFKPFGAGCPYDTRWVQGLQVPHPPQLWQSDSSSVCTIVTIGESRFRQFPTPYGATMNPAQDTLSPVQFNSICVLQCYIITYSFSKPMWIRQKIAKVKDLLGILYSPLRS